MTQSEGWAPAVPVTGPGEGQAHLYAAVLQGRLQLQLGCGALLLVGLPHVLHGRRVDVVQLRT